MVMANSPIAQATQHPASSAPPSESPITQVSQHPPIRHHTHRHGQHGYGGFPSTLYLDLRGTRFEIERDVLVSLPESILIVMFPNGLILGQPARARPYPSPSQQPPQTQQQQAQLPQHAHQQELLQQQVPPRSRQPADQQQPAVLSSSSGPSLQTLPQQQQQLEPTAQGPASTSQHHRRQSSSDSSYYDDEDYDDDYDDDYYDDEDDEGEDEEEYESEDEEEYMSMEDQVIHVDFDPSCMAFLLNVYRQAQQAGEAHRQQQIQLMLQKQRLAQAQAQAHQQPQHQQPQQKQQLSLQDLVRAQALSQSQAQTQQAHAQNLNLNNNSNNSNSNVINSNDNALAVDQQALHPITASDSTAPVAVDSTNYTKAAVVPRTGADSGTAGTSYSPSGPPTLPVVPLVSSSSSSSSSPPPTTTSTSTLTSTSVSHTTPVSQPRPSTAAQQQQNELHQLQQQQIYQNSSFSPSSSSTSSSAASSRSNLALSTPPATNPLLNKQAIIVLREELDYFAITPPKAGFPAKDDLLATGPVLTDLTGLKVKTSCGQYLLAQSKIFTALQRNISKENNVAEQHLIDMLCVSGFSKDDEWGYRRMETGRTSIASLSLVMLKTAGDGNQMSTAQKLLLFWRKPARKCWWDGVQIELDHNNDKVPIRLWARRTWTLELVLV